MKNYEKLILRISVILILIGFIVLYISSIFYEPRIISISEINSNFVGKNIKVYGNITYLNWKDNNLFLIVSERNSDIFVVKFSIKDHTFKKHQNIYVSGQVNIYQGDLEIIADRLESP